MVKQTIQELHSEFISYQRYTLHQSEKTIRGYEQTFKLLLVRYPELTVSMLTDKIIFGFFEWLQTRDRVVGRGEIRKGVKRSTIATYWTKLSGFFQWLVKKGYLKLNPLDSDLNKYPDVEYADKKWLGKNQIERIILTLNTYSWKNNLVKKRNIAMFNTLLFTGVRKGELLGLRLDDVDLEKRELRVRAETSKSRRQRLLPIHGDLCKILRDYLDERNRAGYKAINFWISDGQDRGFTANGLKHLVQLLVKESGTKFYVHQLRHTFAINLLNNNVDIAKLKQLLGHRDIRMTASYVRCLPPETLSADVNLLRLDKLV